MSAANEKYLKACGKSVTKGEREYLRKMAEEAPAGPESFIVNIGVFRGATMYCLRAGAPKARLLGVDIANTNFPLQDLDAEFLWEDSTVCHSKVTDPIDLIFIDGDHHYATVRADIINWSPKVKVGGVMVFHDCYPTPEGLRKNPHIAGVNVAVREWYDKNREEWGEVEAVDSLRAFRRKAAFAEVVK